MNGLFRISGVMSLTAIAASVGAQATTSLPLEPGLWEITARPDFKGIPMMAVPKVARRCLAEDDIKAGKIPLASLPDCRVAGGRWIDARALLDFQCEGLVPGVRVLGEVAGAGKTLSGGVELVQPPQPDGAVAPVSIKYQHSGRWLGAECGAPTGVDGLGPKY